MNSVVKPGPALQDRQESSRSYVCPKCGEISQISETRYNTLSDTITKGWIVDVGLACSRCGIVHRFSEIRRQISSRQSNVEKMVENISTR